MSNPQETLTAQRLGGQARWWFGGAVGLAALAALWPDAALDSLRFVVENLVLMAPVIAFAVLLASSIRASGADGLMARAFEGRPMTVILVAAGVGAITPICGVGVLPIIAGLLAAGVPLAPIMAFWLASPITDPAMLAITAGTLGVGFAIGKTVIACLAGLLGGYATEVLVRGGRFRSPLKSGISGLAGSCVEDCAPQGLYWRFWREPARRRKFLSEARTSGLTMLKWLTLAFALESVLRSHLPPEMIAPYVGNDATWAIPVAVLVGTPIYLDGYAALPLIRGLMDLGMAPGAAMAFLVSGGITSLYASVAVFALVRLPVFLWYLALAVVCSLLGGLLYQAALAI